MDGSEGGGGGGGGGELPQLLLAAASEMLLDVGTAVIGEAAILQGMPVTVCNLRKHNAAMHPDQCHHRRERHAAVRHGSMTCKARVNKQKHSKGSPPEGDSRDVD